MTPLLKPRLRRPSQSFRLSHLLIVAGPSGAGKSTFLRALAERRLPHDLLAALPEGASGWPQTNGRRVIRGRLPKDAAARLVLHYDFLRPFETAIADYADDPSLAVLGWADAVSVCMIAGPSDGLADRLAARPPVARPLRRIMGGLSRRLGMSRRRTARRPYDPATEDVRHRRLVALYRTADFLPAWEGRWLAHLRAVLGERLHTTIRVSGDGAGGGFRLLSRADGGDIPGGSA